MTPAQIIVTLVGAGGIALVVWFFWLTKTEGMRAVLTAAGYQEQMILVKGGYTPDTVIVERGKPVRLVFQREETSACSEQVIFADFNKAAQLPEGKSVAVELMPNERGAYPFTCQMGMLRGTLVVE